MKRITHSKKTLGAVLIGAAGLALGSVGFSAWVIGNGSSTSDAKSVGIGVSSATDNLVFFTTQPAFSNTIQKGTEQKTDSSATATYYGSTKDKTAVNAGNTEAYVVFGPNPLSSGTILVDDGTAADWEHMKIEFTFTVEWPSAKKLKIHVDSAGTAVTPLTTAATNSYIVNPDSFAAKDVVAAYDGTPSSMVVAGTTTGWSVSASEYSDDNTTSRKTVTVTVAMQWTWGSALGGSSSDPCTAAVDTATAQTFKTNLNNLYTSLSGGKTFSLTVVASAVA